MTASTYMYTIPCYSCMYFFDLYYTLFNTLFPDGNCMIQVIRKVIANTTEGNCNQKVVARLATTF